MPSKYDVMVMTVKYGVDLQEVNSTAQSYATVTRIVPSIYIKPIKMKWLVLIAGYGHTIEVIMCVI